MAITDLDGCFQETNPAYREIVGRTHLDLQKESILSITHNDDRENCRHHLDELLSGQTLSFVLEKRYMRPDESSVWVRNSFSLLKDEHGRPCHIILICNDITERRRAERLLVEQEKLALVGQLATSIAHEINNPLEAALNLLYLVRESVSLNEAREFVLQTEEEIQRASHIANNTLKFHKQQSKPACISVVQLVESVLYLFKGKFAGRTLGSFAMKRSIRVCGVFHWGGVFKDWLGQSVQPELRRQGPSILPSGYLVRPPRAFRNHPY
jgi:PAS domain S-box-containing protein